MDRDEPKINHRELVEILIKHFDLRDGVWHLIVDFRFAGANIGSTAEELLPTALVGIHAVGLKRVEKEGPLAVDAAKVNPSKPLAVDRKGLTPSR